MGTWPTEVLRKGHAREEAAEDTQLLQATPGHIPTNANIYGTPGTCRELGYFTSFIPFRNRSGVDRRGASSHRENKYLAEQDDLGFEPAAQLRKSSSKPRCPRHTVGVGDGAGSFWEDIIQSPHKNIFPGPCIFISLIFLLRAKITFHLRAKEISSNLDAIWNLCLL